MGGWRKLHNKELCDLVSSPNIIKIIKLRRMRWEGHGAQMVEKRNAYRLLIGKPEGTMLGGVPVPTAWRVLGLRMEEWPPAEVSCEYTE
jgi:hypothetical protein